MKILICDDEKTICGDIKDTLLKADGDSEIIMYESADDLLKSDFMSADIIFLDIEMQGTSGVGAANKIRETQRTKSMEAWGALPLIIFVTGHSGYMKDAFSVHAYGYIVKPIDKDELTALYLQAEEVCRTSRKSIKSTLTVKVGGESITLRTDDIYYAESEKRKNIIHLKDETVSYYGSMDKLEEEVPDSFYRVHKGYLINMKYIEKYDRTTVYLRGGAALLISKYRYKDFVDAYFNYLKRQ